MAGPFLWLREELGPLVEHREPSLVGFGVSEFPGTRLWLGGTPLPLAGFQGPD